MRDHGVERTMLGLGGTAAFDPSVRLTCQLCGEHLDQTGFTNSRLPAEQHELSQAVLNLRPPIKEQADLLLSTHQGGESLDGCHIETCLGSTLMQDLVDPHGLYQAFELLSPKCLTDKIPLDETGGRLTDDDRIRRGQTLKPCRNVGSLPKR